MNLRNKTSKALEIIAIERIATPEYRQWWHTDTDTPSCINAPTTHPLMNHQENARDKTAEALVMIAIEWVATPDYRQSRHEDGDTPPNIGSIKQDSA